MIKIKLPINKLLCTLLVATLLAGNNVTAQVNPSHTIRLKAGDITTSSNAAAWFAASRDKRQTTKEPVQALIQFNKLPDADQIQALKRNGITLFDYLPDNAYNAIIDYSANVDGALQNNIYNITETKPEWKADDFVWKQVRASAKPVEILVTVFPDVTAAQLSAQIAARGGKVNNSPLQRYGSYRVTLAGNQVYNLAQWYGIKYISPVTDIVPLDLQSRPAVKGNVAAASRNYGGYELNGDSVTVGVGDNCSGVLHADMDGRITDFSPAPLSHHGAHVNGIIGASALVDPLAVSMAPRVSLVDFLYDLILPATGAMYRDYNMTITNNSYTLIAGSCEYCGTYDSYSQFMDTMALEYTEVQHVFASGNDGGMTCGSFLRGFATVGGGYQPSKNTLVVGSMTDYLIQADDESRGPVKDGRLKPEMVAIGLGSYSTIAEDKYIWAAGTSMASPMVAGGLAILTQHYKRLNGGVQPRADIMRAVMLNGALDLGNPGPDFSYGFGGMDISRSLKILDAGNYRTNTLSNGDSQTVSVTIPPNTAQVKVMLLWNDFPGSALAAKELVNDLDVTVTDPTGATHLPLVLDPTPTNVNNIATEQRDRLNNTEQVMITNPPAGTYTISTKGYSIPKGPQPYVVTYDIIPKGLTLTYPLGGEQLSDKDSIRIFWNTISDGNRFTVQYSTDDGAAWTTLSDTIPASIRYISFMPSGINSGRCRVRITRNNTTDAAISQRFNINKQPVAVLDTAQCPGYVNIHWSPIPNASKYYLHKKAGQYLQLCDSTTDTAYSYSGMSLRIKSYVAVQPVIDGAPGYRSVAAITVANSGNCTKSVSNGDLALERITSPSNGRMYTSSQMTSGTELKVLVKNLYSSDCPGYTIAWQHNGGAWTNAAGTTTLPANSAKEITIPGIDFTSIGPHIIRVAIHNLSATDRVATNDTLTTTIVNIDNTPLNLATPFSDDFETMDKVSVNHDTVGVSANGHWDFFTLNDTGRMRSFVHADVTLAGVRSVSLDQKLSSKNGSGNRFVGTFNLGGYDTSNAEVRVDFDYMLHGIPKSAAGNIISARGNDTAGWQTLAGYNLGTYPGILNHIKSVSLTDAIRKGKHNFSTSAQLAICQNDTSLIATYNYGNGITIDNFKLYTVTNDASLMAVLSPAPSNCGLPASTPLTVRVTNGVNNVLRNVQVFYNFDGGPTFSGLIDSIKAKSSADYTFAQELSVPIGATHTLNVWLRQPGDSYTDNDSILNYKIRNSEIVTNFPYLENFEQGDGGYFSDGFRNSWQYGAPASPKINKAASGTKAWKTNLTGRYNNLERSYLYSPCFDISQMDQPTLSFSAAMDIENCGNTLCDAAFVEYSFDGAVWTKLGESGKGTNWYDSTFEVWNSSGPGATRWHVVTTDIPQLGSGQTTHLRFALATDPGATYEGIAIDDIHIYDKARTILPAKGEETAAVTPSANAWNSVLLNEQLMGALQPGLTNVGNVRMTLYRQETIINPGATQFVMPRSYLIQSNQTISDSIGVRLYLLDSELVAVQNAKNCPSCTPVSDAYSLGVTQYANSTMPGLENKTLADDTGGVLNYYPAAKIKWVPYDKGYYGELKVNPLSEFWLNTGGPTNCFAANTDYLNFAAYRNGANVNAYWYSLIDTAVASYYLQRAEDSGAFETIKTIAANGLNPGMYSIIDSVNITSDEHTYYYRLKWLMQGKETPYYSPVRKIMFNDSEANTILLNARMAGKGAVGVNWTSYLDGVATRYVVERAIGTKAFAKISDKKSGRLYGKQYNILDTDFGTLPSGTQIHYRLTAYLDDNTALVLPIRTVDWVDGNAIVNIYPNPTHDGAITINWNANPGVQMQLTITDAIGRMWHNQTITANQWDNTTLLQTDRLPTGLYLIRMDIEGRKYVSKIVYE